MSNQDHEATARRLLPCLIVYGAACPNPATTHYDSCPAYYRQAVAAALAERDGEIDRLLENSLACADTQDTVIADLRAKLIEAEKEIASLCFAAGATSDDGTSIAAVKSLVAERDRLQAEIAKAGKPNTISLEQFATDYPCHCAENYPGTTAYHGHDCQNEVVQEFVAQWQSKAGK